MTPPEPGDVSAASQEAIYAALEALETALGADLCAFLTEDASQGPQLFLGVPDLGAIDPNKAFALFTALREALATESEPVDRLVAGYEAVLVPHTAGADKALLAVGRKKDGPTPKERDSVVRFAGALIRMLRIGAPAPVAAVRPRIVRIGVESAADRCTAQVSLDFGEQVVHGTGEDHTPLRAVAVATLDAAGPMAAGLKLSHIAEGDIASSRAVLVLLVDEQDATWLGSALVDENADPLHSAARATLSGLLQTRPES